MPKIDYRVYIPRLKELSAEYLNCSLDDNPPEYIPEDLIEGSYRWFLYLYSNMFKENGDHISCSDKQMFVVLSTKFKTDHLINWTRDKLIALKKENILQIKSVCITVMNDTFSFFKLKVSIYMLKCVSEGWLYADPYIIGIMPELERFTC